MSRLLGETAQAVAVAAALALFVGFLMEAAVALRPAPPDDGLRREPPAVVGARVITPHGPGVITKEVRYWDGSLWQVRLENGRYALVYRAEMIVIPGGGDA